MVNTVTDSRSESLVLEAKPELKEPALYQVIMHNDDFSPMEFVVEVLELFFNMDRTRATAIMYEVHLAGKAVCGIFTKDVAQTKVEQVVDYARRHEHPLLCSIEAI
ncbi:MAG: ATP-dependent Clp protease adapter ClpS [Gammaproteobacteria bacterium]|nr:ATP-dependent Clp protease adapter ClpS [Gammaproteobacteria bacterium]